MDSQCQEFLKKNGLENYITSFKDEYIDFDTLQLLTNDQIKQLLPGIGLQARFKNGLKEISNMPCGNLEKTLSTASTVILLNSDVEIEESYDEASKSIKTEPVSPEPTRFGLSALNLNLKELLDQTTTGSSIIMYYKLNNSLDMTRRRKLVDLITDSIMKQSPGLKEADFFMMCKEILQLFPTEITDTYFVPCCESPGNQASGLLVCNYKNKRSSLTRIGVLKRKSDTQDATNQVHKDKLPSDEVLQQVNWLKCNSDPWNEVSEKWTNTSNYRLNQWSLNHSSFSAITEEYATLAHPEGYQLVNIDFKEKHPGKENNLLNDWQNISTILVTHMKKVFKKDDSIMMLLDSVDVSGQNQCAVFLLLHKLLPPSILHTQTKSWHPTVCDSQNAFIFLINDATSIEIAIVKKKETMRNLKLTLQPFILAIGETIYKAEFFMVYIDGVFYKFNNICDAVDTAFKCFQVFNLEYPKECNLVWLFLQQAVYRIFTKYDNIGAKKLKSVKNFKVSSLIADLKL